MNSIKNVKLSRHSCPGVQIAYHAEYQVTDMYNITKQMHMVKGEIKDA